MKKKWTEVYYVFRKAHLKCVYNSFCRFFVKVNILNLIFLKRDLADIKVAFPAILHIVRVPGEIWSRWYVNWKLKTETEKSRERRRKYLRKIKRLRRKQIRLYLSRLLCLALFLLDLFCQTSPLTLQLFYSFIREPSLNNFTNITCDHFSVRVVSCLLLQPLSYLLHL